MLRGAIGDLFDDFWRFLAANLVLGGFLVIIALAAIASAWLLFLLPLAAVPAAGTMRMATTRVRDGDADFGAFTTVVRHPRRVLTVGVMQSIACLVLLVDMRLGAWIGSFLGLLLSVGALYGLAIGWAYAAAAWTLMLDPERDDDPLAAVLRLAGILLLAHPIRVGGFLLLVGLLLGVTALLIAPFLTFTVALAWLVIARFVLPVADRIEGRATMEVEP